MFVVSADRSWCSESGIIISNATTTGVDFPGIASSEKKVQNVLHNTARRRPCRLESLLQFLLCIPTYFNDFFWEEIEGLAKTQSKNQRAGDSLGRNVCGDNGFSVWPFWL